ncbi:hypothetical protein ACQKO6_16900 [Pseudomonas monteilii]
MPPVTNEMVYAAMKEAVQRGLLPKGGSQENAIKKFKAVKAVLQAALENRRIGTRYDKLARDIPIVVSLSTVAILLLIVLLRYFHHRPKPEQDEPQAALPIRLCTKFQET